MQGIRASPAIIIAAPEPRTRGFAMLKGDVSRGRIALRPCENGAKVSRSSGRYPGLMIEAGLTA